MDNGKGLGTSEYSKSNGPAGELKNQDAPIEVLVFDPISRLFVRVLVDHIPALWITGLALVLRAVAAALIVQSHLTLAAVLMLLGFVLDAMDGKMARRQNRHAELHGMSNFILDQVAVVLFVLAVGIATPTDSARLSVVWFGVYFLLIAAGATRLRLLGQLNIDWRIPRGTAKLLEKSTEKGALGKVYEFLVRVETPLRMRRIVARPTSIESLVWVAVIGPLLEFEKWVWMIGILLLVPDILACLMSSIILARLSDKERRSKAD
jgi:phosphatidylglycerophosphate synthase